MKKDERREDLLASQRSDKRGAGFVGIEEVW
jgi:hypothetical protein